MKATQKAIQKKRQPAFVARAERAFGRVARKVRADRKVGLAPLVWPSGKRLAAR